jgi:cytochrome c oxidase subunit 3
MIFVVLYMMVAGAFAGWWLARQGLLAKPWLEQGVLANARQNVAVDSTRTLGLRVFLGVAGSLFALLVSAYLMRMQAPDWRPVPLPTIVWFSTGQLLVSCVALEWSRSSARTGDLDAVRSGLLASCLATLAFLAGQLVAWRQLAAAGYLVADNPANSFLYLVTSIHALHVTGGLVVLGVTTKRVWPGLVGPTPHESIQRCATYWNFLLVVWLVLIALLIGWVEDFAVLCRQVLT